MPNFSKYLFLRSQKNATMHSPSRNGKEKHFSTPASLETPSATLVPTTYSTIHRIANHILLFWYKRSVRFSSHSCMACFYSGADFSAPLYFMYSDSNTGWQQLLQLRRQRRQLLPDGWSCCGNHRRQIHRGSGSCSPLRSQSSPNH